MTALNLRELDQNLIQQRYSTEHVQLYFRLIESEVLTRRHRQARNIDLESIETDHDTNQIFVDGGAGLHPRMRTL